MKFTTDEAIHALKYINLSRVHPFYSWEEMGEIRNMAIEALESVKTFTPKRGKWEIISDDDQFEGIYRCSLVGMHFFQMVIFITIVLTVVRI